MDRKSRLELRTFSANTFWQILLFRYGVWDFPRQPNGPFYKDNEGELQIMPLAKGKKINDCPESAQQQMTIENLTGNELQLIDGRGKHNNGWFVVRSLVPKGATKNAVEWLITPHAIKGYRSAPVVQVSQVGYHPAQKKISVIELDAKDNTIHKATLFSFERKWWDGNFIIVATIKWGKFLRYNYLQFDFLQLRKKECM
jgi:hypothetical protein